MSTPQIIFLSKLANSKICITFVRTIVVMTNKDVLMNRELVVALLRSGNRFNDELNLLTKSLEFHYRSLMCYVSSEVRKETC